MHEVSIMENVIEIVTQKAIESKFTKINNVSLKIGELSGVMSESLSFAFNCCKIGTMLEAATLEIEKVNAMAQCKDCNQLFEIDHFNKFCPSCNQFSNNIVSGYELYVNTIEGD
jgi:hydrogenase nickel incorporation protein HypA/HybF